MTANHVSFHAPQLGASPERAAVPPPRDSNERQANFAVVAVWSYNWPEPAGFSGAVRPSRSFDRCERSVRRGAEPRVASVATEPRSASRRPEKAALLPGQLSGPTRQRREVSPDAHSSRGGEGTAARSGEASQTERRESET